MSVVLNPEDVLRVWQCLQASLSLNNAERQQAEADLSERATQPHYCSCLVEILGHKEVDESAQWLAAVQLKNCISRHWAPRRGRDAPAPGSLSDEEKMHLRGKMMGLILLANNKLSIQVAVIFAKIARNDYPAAWPTLFDDLINNLKDQEPGSLLTRCTLLILHHILKELASKRLVADQRRFEEISQRLIDFIWQHWVSGAQAIMALLPSGLESSRSDEAVQLEIHFSKWMLSTKILRRILVSGFGKDRETLEPVGHVCECLPPILHMLTTLAQHRPAALTPGYKCHVMLDVALLKLFKVTNTVVEVHPWAVQASGTLLGCLQTYVLIITSARKGGAAWQRITARAMKFVSLVIQNASYNGKQQLVSLKSRAGFSVEQLAAALETKSQEVTTGLSAFWAENRTRERLIESLLTQHLPLTRDDLEEWSDDPETWYHSHEGISSEDEPRGITEILFLGLLQHDPEALCPMVRNAIVAARHSVPHAILAAPTIDAASLSALLAKEAMYNAACCAAYELFDHLDFKEWLDNSLLPDLLVITPHNKVLQRRILRLLAEWVASIKTDDRPRVYSAIVTLLTGPQAGGDADLCLHLVAVETLRVLVEDWDFKEEQFLPFLQPVLSHLPHLLQACSSFDSHTQVFTLVSSIVERMGDYVTPHATTILAWLPEVWHNSAGQGLLRMQVIALLQRLVNALNESSPAMYPFLAVVLEYALDPAGDEALNLLEDALLLWLVALRNAPTGTLDLLALWPVWTRVMAASIEHVEVCMHIASSCALLGGAPFLQAHGAEFADTLARVLGDVNQKGMLAVYGPLEQLLQVYGEEACRLLQRPLLKLLHLLSIGEEEALSWAKGISVMARVLLHCPQACLDLFAVGAREGIRVIPRGAPPPPAPAAPLSGPDLFLAFLSEWLNRFDGIANASDRKLCALALAHALPLPVPGILGALDLLVPVITSVWYLAEGGGDAEPAAYAFDVYTSERDETDALVLATATSEDADGETQRKRQLVENDPVRTVKLSAWVKEQFQQAERVHGQNLSNAINALGAPVADPLRAMWA